VRENLHRYQGDFEETVNKSLNETLVRSINTTFVTLLSLLAIFFFGGATIKYFALALIVGITAGTYSSIFLAAPGLVTWQNWTRKSSK
jgi:preprotein translocase subunit SecF